MALIFCTILELYFAQVVALTFVTEEVSKAVGYASKYWPSKVVAKVMRERQEERLTQNTLLALQKSNTLHHAITVVKHDGITILKNLVRGDGRIDVAKYRTFVGENLREVEKCSEVCCFDVTQCKIFNSLTNISIEYLTSPKKKNQ